MPPGEVRRAFALLTITAIVGGACSELGGSAAPGATVPTTASTIESEVDPPPPNPPRPGRVEFVQDGDSAIVTIGGAEERIRLIGINTPERDECFGEEARQLLRDLIEGQQVDVVTDVDTTDRFGRILTYLYLDGVLINAELVRRGAAIARPFEPNTTLQSHLESAEATAQATGAGMWAATACGGDEAPAVAIVEVNADAPGRDDENLNGEFVIVENLSADPVDLTGWGLKDESSIHRFTFPSGSVLSPGAQLVVYTGCGANQMPTLYWCDGTPVWDNGGDTAFLTDPAGRIRHRLSY